MQKTFNSASLDPGSSRRSTLLLSDLHYQPTKIPFGDPKREH
jgi:hypothetical protein